MDAAGWEQGGKGMATMTGGSSLDQTWARICGKLRDELGETAYRNWLKPLTLSGVRGNEVLRVLTRLNEDVNEEWISDKARFACDGLKRQRLDRPYVRKDGKLQPATWQAAFAAIADKLGRMAALAVEQCSRNRHLLAVIIDYLARLKHPKLTMVSPDAGGAERARAYAKRLDAELAVIDKRRSEDGTDNEGVNMSETFVHLKPRDQWRAGLEKDHLVDAMRDSLAAIPGVRFSFSQPIKDNVEEAVSGVRGQVVLKIFGADLDVMKATLEQCLGPLGKVPGVVDLGLGGEVDAGLLLAGGGVEHDSLTARSAIDDLAVDPVRDAIHRELPCGGGGWVRWRKVRPDTG